MPDLNDPNMLNNLVSPQTVISFTFGMLVGSFIGLTGIVILILSIIIYDSKDSIIELSKRLSRQISFIESKENNSWYYWCTGLIGFRRENKRVR